MHGHTSANDGTAACGEGCDCTLRVRRMAIDTYQEAVAYMRADCTVCRAEGFEAQSRLQLRLGERAARWDSWMPPGRPWLRPMEIRYACGTRAIALVRGSA